MCTLYMYFSDDKVELLDPPFNSEPGECVFVEGYERKTLGGKSDTILSHPLFTTLDLVLTSVTVVCLLQHYFLRKMFVQQSERTIQFCTEFLRFQLIDFPDNLFFILA
jgi:hypothetical protein